MLKTIISANTFYCLISAVIGFTLSGITSLGQALLFIEMLVIGIVIGIELRVLKRMI